MGKLDVYNAYDYLIYIYVAEKFIRRSIWTNYNSIYAGSAFLALLLQDAERTFLYTEPRRL